MAPDKYSAVWISHTSLNDYLRCPRAYYLKHIYKDPHTRHKIKLITPPLSLGSAVHEVIESYSVLPLKERFFGSMIEKYNIIWEKVSGKKGGFLTDESERTYKSRGADMIRRVMKHPGPLAKMAIKIKKDLPYFWLSEEAGIILCGKIDWLEYLSETDSVHIIDFKTSKYDESDNSLQLPIYYLLATECQTRPVTKASYWYIGRSDDLSEKKLPDLATSRQKILDIGNRIKTARKLEVFSCPNGAGGCRECAPYERLLKGEGEFVGLDQYKTDLYILPSVADDSMESEML